jgi:predicted XRE-type DNA-binding protein
MGYYDLLLQNFLFIQSDSSWNQRSDSATKLATILEIRQKIMSMIICWLEEITAGSEAVQI